MHFEPLPPPPKPALSKHQRQARALRERPGEWAVTGTYTSRNAADTMASQIRHARGQSGRWYKPAGAYETQYRLVQGEHRVYARYIGEVAVA